MANLSILPQAHNKDRPAAVIPQKTGTLPSATPLTWTILPLTADHHQPALPQIGKLYTASALPRTKITCSGRSVQVLNKDRPAAAIPRKKWRPKSATPQTRTKLPRSADHHQPALPHIGKLYMVYALQQTDNTFSSHSVHLIAST